MFQCFMFKVVIDPLEETYVYNDAHIGLYY